jgi:hypothetical protein
MPSGKEIVFNASMPAGVEPAGILIKPLDKPPIVFRRLTSLAGTSPPRLSPDGTRIAYAVGESGRAEIVLDTLPTPSARPVQVSRGGGNHPRWSADGRELFFVSGNSLMVVPTPQGQPITAASASQLFVLPPGSGGLPSDFAVYPDGSRFLIVVPTSVASSTVKLSLNWRPAR